MSRLPRPELRIHPATPRDGIPLEWVAERLEALQRSLYVAATALTAGGSRGAFKAEVLEACRLVWRESRAGSLVVEAGFQAETSGGEDSIKLARDATHLLEDTLVAAQSGDWRSVVERVPDRQLESRLRNSVVQMLPESDAGYDIAISLRGTPIRFDDQARSNVMEIGYRPALSSTLPVREVTGELFRVQRGGKGGRLIGLYVGGREVLCSFDADLDELVQDLVIGSLVRVAGRALLDSSGLVQRMEEVLDVQTASLGPMFMEYIDYDGRRFDLGRAIAVTPSYQDDLWVYSYEPLGLHAYALKRDECARLFRMQFSAVWDEIAQQDDDRLTEDARALKAALQSLVSKVSWK